MPLEIRSIDREIFAHSLKNFLPRQIIDVHTHIWLKSFVKSAPVDTRTVQWAESVAEENRPEDLLADYAAMLPGIKVDPLLFGWPERHINLDENNRWVSRVAGSYHLPALYVPVPEQSAQEVEQKVLEGNFVGLKPYLSLSPAQLPAEQITIYDFLPHAQLEVANTHGWIIMLHIPRPKRLGDPLNLAQMLEIEKRYPNVRMIIAHIGRAYCPEDVADAFRVLRQTEFMLFDFSANTNGQVMQDLIRCVGPRRILFGSDMPVTRMRMRRICQDGMYINLVPPDLYWGAAEDPHMREISVEEGNNLSFFLYEELLAFRTAAEKTNLNSSDIEDVFYRNALQLLKRTR
jgi:uncharacterized protein